MVKKFKRPGAGDGDQLPSDLRPPQVLKTTCDYLFHDLLTNAPSLASVHGFIWDRTRAIRNDFSIQQVSKLEDVRIAIECFERIARFHILALHQMATPESQQQTRKAETTYDPQQEREQLDRTLLSLMQYYDDYRGRLELTNEAEFRSYCVLFQLDSSQTDTEDRVQSWPRALLGDRNIQAAMQLFAAACTTLRRLGPFKALATEHVVARQDWESFWKLINSSKVSYLQACVAEIYFHLIRDTVLRSIVRAMRPSKAVNGKVNPSTDWSMHDLRHLFNFDDDEQLVRFCALYDLDFHQVGDEDYLDVSPVAGRTLQTPTFSKSIQQSSWIVEQKRHGRSWAAVIDGMSVQQAQDAGMVEKADGNEDMADVTGDDGATGSVEEDPESLFIPEGHGSSSTVVQEDTSSKTATGFMSATPFGKPSLASSTPFGQSKPSIFGTSSGPSLNQPPAVGQPTPPTQAFGQSKPTEPSEKKSTFNFLGPSANTSSTEAKPATSGASAFPSMTSASLFSKPTTSPSTTASAARSSDEPAPKLFASPFGTPAESSDKPATKLFASPFGTPPTSAAPSLFAPKQDPIASTDYTNPFKPTTGTDNPFLAPSAGPKASPEKPPAPTFSFSKPDEAQNVPSLFGGLSARTPAAPSESASDETNTKPNTTQNPFTSTTTPTTTSHAAQDTSANTQTTGSHSPPRRSSISNLPDTKPKKPSPLSNSFTFSEESGSLGGAPQNSIPTSFPATELFPGRQKTGLPPSFTQIKPAQVPAKQQAAPNFDAVLTRLSEELTTDPASGFLKQYVDYTVKQVITKVQEDLYWERINREADEFRTWFLQDKFGKKWRDICRRQRLTKQARERRKRAQKRLHESHRSDAHEHPSIVDAASSFRSSKAGSVANHQSKRERVDAMYRSIIPSSRFSGDRQAQAGSKRSQSPDPAELLAENGHKRMKSTSHVDDLGRVVKSQPNGNARSSFLNFSLASNATNRGSTTKSTYFRMKALGVKQSTDARLGFSRGTKRPRSESMNIDADTQRSLSSSLLLGSSPDQLRERDDGQVRPPSRSVRSKTNDDDEALFARLRAAREGLMESESFMKSEVEKDGELRRSASSLSDRESPSLARARAEIRFRASQADSDFSASVGGRDVPAYRLRESRFVPKENYSRAIERASEILASRSQNASEARSKAGLFSFDTPAKDDVDNVSHSHAAHAPLPGLKPSAMNGSHDTSTVSGMFLSGAPADQSSGTNGMQSTSLGGPSFAEPTFALSAQSIPQLALPATNGAPNPFSENSFTQDSQNPFLQAPVSNGSFIAGPQSDAAFTAPSQVSHSLAFDAPATSFAHDNYIQPSQIGDALSQSFKKPRQEEQNSFASPPSRTNPSQSLQAPLQGDPLTSGKDGAKEQSEEDEDADIAADHFDHGMDVDPSEHDDSESEASAGFNPNASANRFAMLVDNEEDNESQESSPEDELDQRWNGPADSQSAGDEETEIQPDSYQYDNGMTEEYDSENAEEFQDDGEIHRRGDFAAGEDGEEYYSDEEGEDAEDEMEYDSEEGSYDEDEEDGRPLVPQAAFGYSQPQPNEALQVVGNNVEEAIELSD